MTFTTKFILEESLKSNLSEEIKKQLATNLRRLNQKAVIHILSDSRGQYLPRGFVSDHTPWFRTFKRPAY